MMKIKQLIQNRPEAGSLVILLVMIFIFSFLSPAFLTYDNFQVVLQPIPEITLIAVGVTILMISGEFDLSVGSVFALSPMIMVLFLDSGLPLIGSIFLGLSVAALVGLVNATITINLKIPSFIATLGMLFMARSLAIVISGGFPPPLPSDLDLGWIVGRVELLRVSIFWLLGIIILLTVWLRKFDSGSWVYATGGQFEAARDMGINTNLVKTVCFVLCSMLAGFAGMIQVFRIGVIIPSTGAGFELTAIAASVIGGVSLSGGVGSIVGALIGSLLIAFVENIIILTRIDANWFRFAVGAIIVVAVAMNKFTRNLAEKSILKER